VYRAASAFFAALVLGACAGVPPIPSPSRVLPEPVATTPVMSATPGPHLTEVPSATNLGNFGLSSTNDFDLTIQADSLQYLEWEPMRIQATLTYRGTKETITLPCPPRPVMFGFSQLDGDLAQGEPEAWPLMCEATELRRGRPVVLPYSSEGHGWAARDPNAAVYHQILTPPSLQLPTGEWVIYAWSWAGSGSRDPWTNEVPMTASITITTLRAAD
jgi:hypothetical protein